MEELIKKLEDEFKDAHVQWLRAKVHEENEVLQFTSGRINVLTNTLMYLYKKNK